MTCIRKVGVRHAEEHPRPEEGVSFSPSVTPFFSHTLFLFFTLFFCVKVSFSSATMESAVKCKMRVRCPCALFRQATFLPHSTPPPSSNPSSLPTQSSPVRPSPLHSLDPFSRSFSSPFTLCQLPPSPYFQHTAPFRKRHPLARRRRRRFEKYLVHAAVSLLPLKGSLERGGGGLRSEQNEEGADTRFLLRNMGAQKKKKGTESRVRMRRAGRSEREKCMHEMKRERATIRRAFVFGKTRIQSLAVEKGGWKLKPPIEFPISSIILTKLGTFSVQNLDTKEEK